MQFQHLYLLGRSATPACGISSNKTWKVSTPLSSGKVCDKRSIPVTPGMRIVFQHLYLLGRSATPQCNEVHPGTLILVSTPLPSGKVCDCEAALPSSGTKCSFNTFTFWEGLRLEGAEVEYEDAKFQHLYLLGRSATPPFYIPCPERDPATICEGSQNLYSYAPKTAPQSPSNPCTAIHRGIERENQPLRAFSNLLDHTSEPTRSASLRRIVQNWMVSAIVINRSLINTC